MTPHTACLITTLLIIVGALALNAQSPDKPVPDQRMSLFVAWKKMMSDPDLLSFEEWNMLEKGGLLRGR